MLQDDLQHVINCIYRYILSNEEYVSRLLIKKHSGNLRTLGDLSFPNTVESWQELLSAAELQNITDKSFLKCINKDVTDIVQASQTWEIPVVKAAELNNRIHLFLDRPKSIQIGFQSTLQNSNILLQRLNEDSTQIGIDSKCTDHNSVTFLRLKYLAKAVENLCLINDIDKNINICVTWKISNGDNKYVFCGNVLNAKTGQKENIITAEEYIKIRQDELTLIAQHKYGVRVSTDIKWREFIAHLGESAVTFELLQIKASSPVKIQFDAAGGSSKGAAFILYNCARLETMIRTFNEKVENGSYPSLPAFENTDLSLLNDEDEWSLIFTYIMGLPSVLNNSVQLNDKYEFRPHLICNFLSGLVKVFSQYYRRVRILTEPRKHLLPVMFARIHMLFILNNTLKMCLRILNIKSVSQMYTVFALSNNYSYRSEDTI